MKKFAIVIPSYKNIKWAEKNISSAITQKYDNFRIIYTDDNSPDGTAEAVEKYIEKNDPDNRVTLIKNEVRKGALENLYDMIHSCDDDEIIVTLDGDDWFPHQNVLSKLNQVYSTEDLWMTYGQYQDTRGGTGCSRQIPKHVIASNSFRKYHWCSSHLRTFYAWLFKKINKDDFLYEGKFMSMAWDLPIMFGCLEMAGQHSKFLPDILYVYNVENPIQDWKVNIKWQQKLEMIVRGRKPYGRISKSPINDNEQ